MQIRFFTFVEWLRTLACAGLLCIATGCKEKEVAAKAHADSAPAHANDETHSSQPSHASDPEEKSEATFHAPELAQRASGVRFDHRVLSREKENSFKANWSKTIALTRSKYYFLKIELLFDLTNEAVSKDFAGTSPIYVALSEKIESVFAMCRTSDLQGAEAMEKRREQLIQTLNAYFGATVVRDVSYVEYRLGQR